MNNPTIQMTNITISNWYEKKLLLSTLYLNKSVKNVIGEKKDKINKEGGELLRGIKIPLINSKGNLIRFIIIITLDVISVGFAAINSPNKDPKSDIRIIPKNNRNNAKSELIIAIIELIIRIKIIAIIDVIVNEYRVEAVIIPHKISFNDIGEAIIRSKDFSRVSIGKTTGLMAVAVKKDVIDIIPINTEFKEMSLPITQESVMKKGNNKPKIKTGPFLIYREIFFLLNIQIRFKLYFIIFYHAPLL